MSYTRPTASTITLSGGSWQNIEFRHDSSQDTSTSSFYELWYTNTGTWASGGHGIELRQGTDSNGNVTTTLYCNTDNNNTADPYYVYIGAGAVQQNAAAQSVVLPSSPNNETIAFLDATAAGFPNATDIMSFTLTNSMLWTGQSSSWTITGTHTPATGTQSHSYVQDSIRDITCTKTAAYQFEWEFKFRDVSSAPYNQAMGQNAVTMTARKNGSTAQADNIQYTFSQVDSTNKMTITSATTFPNAQIVTGDVVTLLSDIDMQVQVNGNWSWVTAGDTIASFTYESTNVVYTVGSGYVGDTVTVQVTDTNQFPDYDNDVSLSYALDNPPANHSGSATQLTANVFGNSNASLSSSNSWTLSGTWVVGDDGSSSPTGLSGLFTGWRTTPVPQQLQIAVFTRSFALSPYGQNPNTRRRAHSFW